MWMELICGEKKLGVRKNGNRLNFKCGQCWKDEETLEIKISGKFSVIERC